MMIRIGSFAAALLGIANTSQVMAAQLVREGRPAAVLVVPDSAAQARAAAERIQRIVADMSGAKLEIVAESGPLPRGVISVFVGHTKFAGAKGIRQEILKPEEVVLVSTDQHVIVLGNEGPAGPRKQDVQEGTTFAAVELLEKLGCRRLWPDPSGHVIPKTPNVVLPNGEYRHAKFWNQVAERLEKEAPGLTLGTCAYSVYRSKPLEVQKLYPSIAVGYVGGGYTNRRQHDALIKDWNDWSSLCSQMFWRPNFMKEGEGFPLVWATRMGNDLKYLISRGLIGVEMPNVHHHWGTQGLNYTMLARLMWDHTLAPAAVIDDYCRTGFGAAAPAVRIYIAQLEDLSEQYAKHQAAATGDLDQALVDDEDPDARRKSTVPKMRGPSSWDVVWTDSAMHELDVLLVSAAAAVGPESPAGRRVKILREGFDFAKLELPVRRAIDKYNAASQSKDAEYDLLLAVANVEQWLLAHRDSKSVGVVEGAPYWWRGKRDTKLFSRLTILGRAERVLGTANRYVLTIPAYSQRGRFETVEFSLDGKIWSAPQPYRVRQEYAAPAGAKSVFARLTFKGADGVKPQKPIEVSF